MLSTTIKAWTDVSEWTVFNVVLSLHESKATCFGENRGFYKNVSQVEVNVVTRKHHCSLQIHMAV